MANRIRERIRDTEIVYHGKVIQTTLSAGISQFGRHSDNEDSLYEMADSALQEAKKTGKNRVARAKVAPAEKKSEQQAV